jgi:hypothetical protein
VVGDVVEERLMIGTRQHVVHHLVVWRHGRKDVRRDRIESHVAQADLSSCHILTERFIHHR